jgi:ABC transporter ATM
VLPIHIQASWHTKRIFASTPRHRKDDARARNAQQLLETKQPGEDKVGPAGTVKTEKSQPEVKTDPLLAEQTMSNKEQRKADWAIIKDMSKYLWPKDDFGTKFRVGASVGLLIGAKVGMIHPLILVSLLGVDVVRRSSMCKFPSTLKA